MEQRRTVQLKIEMRKYIAENNVEFPVFMIVDKINMLLMIVNQSHQIPIIYTAVGEECKIKGKSKATIQTKRLVAMQHERCPFLLYLLKGRENQTLRSDR
jgi:hypothetical protein